MVDMIVQHIIPSMIIANVEGFDLSPLKVSADVIKAVSQSKR